MVGSRKALDPNTKYTAAWCGIPWFANGTLFKAVSLNPFSFPDGQIQPKHTQFVTSELGGVNYIEYMDGLTGRQGARLTAPKGVDFHCNLRFEEEGPYIDILNDDGTTAEFLAQVNDLQKGWVDEATKVLAVLLKAMSGGGGGGGN